MLLEASFSTVFYACNGDFYDNLKTRLRCIITGSHNIILDCECSEIVGASLEVVSSIFVDLI